MRDLAKVSYAGVYLFLAQFLKIGLGLGLVLIIPTSRANLALLVIIDRVAGAIIRLVAFVCVCPSV